MSDQFAYGGDSFRTPDGERTDCPAAACGVDPAYESTYNDNRTPAHMANQYDTYVRLELLDGEVPPETTSVTGYLDHAGVDMDGVIDEDTARECWLRAIDAVDSDQAAFGRKIATELGWLGVDD